MINTAIVGCGRIAWKLEEDEKRHKPCTHMGAIAKMPEFVVIGACDSKKSKMMQMVAKYGLNNEICYSDVDDMLTATNPDLLVVAASTNSHYNLIKKAIEVKIPLVVAEKPLSLSLSEARKIMDMLASSKTRVVINHERRYSARYRMLFRMISGKKLGHLRAIHGVLASNSAKSITSKSEDFGGIVLHDGTHLIDLVCRIAGDIAFVQAIGEFHESGVEKWICVQMLSTKGIPVQLDFSAIRDYYHFELDVWGNWGRFIIGNGIYRLYMPQESPFYQGFKSLIAEEGLSQPKNISPFLSLYQEVLAFYRNPSGKKFVFQSEAKDAFKVMQIIDAIYKSARKNGKKIKIALNTSESNASGGI